jgi:hypothetical protein
MSIRTSLLTLSQSNLKTGPDKKNYTKALIKMQELKLKVAKIKIWQ